MPHKASVVAGTVSVLAALALSAPPAQAAGSACEVHSLPSFTNQGEFGEVSTVADIVEVKCETGYASHTVELSSTQLYSECDDHLTWSTASAFVATKGPSISKVTVDSDGNATVALWAGPDCVPGERAINLSEEDSPYQTASTTFEVLPAQPSPEGDAAIPGSELESASSHSIATVIQVEFPDIYSEDAVRVRSEQLFELCGSGTHLTWVGQDGTALSGHEEVTVKLDNDANAFVTVLGTDCSTGSGAVEADLEVSPYQTYDTTFEVEPAEVVSPPTAVIKSPVGGKTYHVGEVVKTKFSCSEGSNGTGLESCTDSNGGSGSTGALYTAASGIYYYTVTAKSKDGWTGPTQIEYAVGPKGSTVFNYCGTYTGCEYAFVTDTAAKTWELPAFGVWGTIEKVRVGKVTYTDFPIETAGYEGCVLTSVKTPTGYNSPGEQGNLECGGAIYETWFAYKL